MKRSHEVPGALRVREYSQVLELAQAVRSSTRSGISCTVDDYGQSHLRGGSYGRLSGQRSAFGYALEEVRACRKILLAAGKRVSIAQAEGVLAHALAAFDEGARPRYDNGMNSTAKTGAERQAAIRARRLADGFCVTCGFPSREGCVTCQACSDRNKARVYAARAQAKKSAEST